MTSSVKLTLLCPSDPTGSKLGGAESYLKTLIKYAPQNFEIEYIGVSTDHDKLPVHKWTDLVFGETRCRFYPLIFVENQNTRSRIPLALSYTLALKKASFDFDYRSVLFNRIEPAIIFRRDRCPQHAIVHYDVKMQMDNRYSEVTWSKFPWLYFRMEDYVFRHIDHVYTVSQNSLSLYQSRYANSKEKFSFLPTTTDETLFYPSAESKQTVREGLVRSRDSLAVTGKWILFVGRLQEAKAPLRLLKAFSLYHKKNPDSFLLIIGEGNLREQVEQSLRRLGLQRHAFLLGKKSQKELLRYYHASDVMILSSHYEGMPISVLECLASGLPVVSTDVGEVKRLVKNGYSGEVVSERSTSLLAEALAQVLSHPGRYTQENCVKSISDYRPAQVLAPVYREIRRLHEVRYGENRPA